MTRMVTVSFPDITWRDEVGPIDGVTAVVWDCLLYTSDAADDQSTV